MTFSVSLIGFVAVAAVLVCCGADAKMDEDMLGLHESSNLRGSTQLMRDFAALPNERAQDVAKEQLESLHIPNSDVHSVRLDKGGRVYYQDKFPNSGDRRRRSAEEEEEAKERVRRFITDNPSTGESPEGIPYYHSKSGASNVLYLDFDGHVNPQDSAWGAFSAQSFDTNGNPSVVNADEKLTIVEIWKLVAEDYAPFNIDVTTEKPSNFQSVTTIHALVTHSDQTDGSPMPETSPGVLGVAYVDIYDYAAIEYYSPALIFADRIDGFAPYTSIVISHECGHNFGLSHHGTSNGDEYAGVYSGTNSYDSWGPIMGSPLGAAVSQFSNGEYPNSNNNQDDVNILKNSLGFRSDEAGATTGSASAVSFSDSTNFAAEGIITSRTDKDWWKVTSSGSGYLSVSASPFLGSMDEGGNNLDIKLTVFGSDGSTVLGSNSPSGKGTAQLTNIAVSVGTYYIEIDGVGVSSNVPSDYGSIGQYEITGTLTSGGTNPPPPPPPPPPGSTTTTTTEAPVDTCPDEDSYEVNNDAASATVVSVSAISDKLLHLCPKDIDVYKINVCNPGHQLLVNIYFDDSDGDLDFYLYNSNLDIIDSSTSATNNEEVSVASSGSIHYVNVVGYTDSSSAPYRMRVCGTGCDGEPSSCPISNDPCEGTVFARNNKKCSKLCGGSYEFYNDASTMPNSPFPNCHSKHCECLASPCDGVVVKGNARKCKKYCGGSPYTFYTDAEDAGFFGCHKKHCECGGTTEGPGEDPCEGTLYKRREKQCRSHCSSLGMGYEFYQHASDVGDGRFVGCDEKHCECVADPCDGTWSIKEKKCKKKCGGSYVFYNDAELAGYTGCHERHCECL
eukprot:m.147588 g.147588  ORF g.147588 m.147588 type:complete len:842 (-) comp13242_c1_seq18:180-2705(-)